MLGEEALGVCLCTSVHGMEADSLLRLEVNAAVCLTRVAA